MNMAFLSAAASQAIPRRSTILRHPFLLPPASIASESLHLSRPSSHASSVLTQSLYMASPYSQLPLAAAVAKTGTMTSLGHFFQLVFAFVLGGLFFSTAVAAITAVTAIGKENLFHLWSIFKLIVGRVWAVFRAGIGEARSVLRMDGKWKWKEGWKALKASLLETRKVAAEGVQTIKAEANFYYAAVGAPGLLPLQYAVDHLFPYSLATQLEDGFRDSLNNVRNPNVRKLSLKEFSVGNRAPQLLSARIYDVGHDAMAFDVDTKWESELKAELTLKTARLGIPIPVTIQKVTFHGVVRLGLVPLTAESPGFGAALVSFPSVPRIGLDVRVAGSEITKVPWLRSELLKEIRTSIEDKLLWPKRTVVPMKTETGRQLLSARELDDLATMDPHLRAENKLAEEKPMLKDYMTSIKPDKNRLASDLDIVVGGSDNDQ